MPGTILGTSRGRGRARRHRGYAGAGRHQHPVRHRRRRHAQGRAPHLDEAKRRGLKIAIVGIPKTIDNDINFVYKTFGFDTADRSRPPKRSTARTPKRAATRTASGSSRLMGRDSGFIVAHAALASRDVNFALIPEIAFQLDGENGLLRHLREPAAGAQSCPHRRGRRGGTEAVR